jgi:lysozyme
MRPSDDCFTLIRKVEGLSLVSYQLNGGWYIGYGHTDITIKRNQNISKFQSEQLLLKDVEFYSDYINGLNLNLSQNQFDAIISFCYSVKLTSFLTSKVLKLIKLDPDSVDIKEQILKWKYITWYDDEGNFQKIELPGLVSRRNLEAQLYFKHNDEN